MNKKDKRNKLIIFGVNLMLVTIAVIIALNTEINVKTINIVGAYASSVALCFLGWKLPISFFLEVMIWQVLASPIGSVLEVYRSWGPYDLIVHFLSGVVAAELGRLIINQIWLNIEMKRKTPTILPKKLAFFSIVTFSMSIAGLWEIFEFTVDSITNGAMQGSLGNTMGDIIAGYLGAILYGVIYYVRRKN